MQLGPYVLENPYILAPMAGVSEMPFRVIARRLGASAAPTELVSAKGLIYGQTRTARYLTHHASEQPFWVQIFGGDAASMAEGAEHAVRLGAKIIDINMGCPVKKVTKNGAGSALLCDPTRAGDIVRAIIARTGAVVTAKIRTGWDPTLINCLEMGAALQAAGVAAVAMHARTRAQGYSGHADWTLIKQLVAALDIPVIGNGDVKTPADALRMQAETGCAAVMIGRAALGNPWIFSQLNAPDPLRAQAPSPQERWNLVQEHLQAHLDFVQDSRIGIKRFRSHLMWYAHGLVGAAAFRQEVNQIDNYVQLVRHCEQFYSTAQAHSDSSAAPQSFDVRTALG